MAAAGLLREILPVTAHSSDNPLPFIILQALNVPQWMCAFYKRSGEGSRCLVPLCVEVTASIFF